MNIATNLERSAYFFPERPAVYEGGLGVTYRQLNEKANRVATALLAMGVTPEDHVGLFAPNSADWVAFYFGVIKTGATAVTLSSALTKGELNLLDRGQEGEICVRGRIVMKGYHNNPNGTRAAFWEDGWLRSGDIGRFDANGYLYIVDRLKDLIITGGENVYSREVEEAIYLRSEVEQCAVLGLPDKEWGERVTAFIVPKPGKTILCDQLASFLKSRLSTFKVPKEYVLMSELPKNAAGKILKRELKKQRIRIESHQEP